MRVATAIDIPALVEMGRKFHAQSGLPFGFDEGAVVDLLAGMIESPAAEILMTDRGAIGGVLNPAYCDSSWIMAVELFWWAEGDGLALLKAFEDWAAEMEASEIRMTSIYDLPRADRLLRRKGYGPTEISYSKVI